jgi:hypothetical protein
MKIFYNPCQINDNNFWGCTQITLNTEGDCIEKMLKTRSLGSLIQTFSLEFLIIAVCGDFNKLNASFKYYAQREKRLKRKQRFASFDETFATKKDTLYVYAQTLAAKDDF